MSSYTLSNASCQPGVHQPTTGPYKMLSEYLAFPNLDQHEWWHHTAPILQNLLVASDYSLHQQYQYMTLYGLHIVPTLGPFPSTSRPDLYLNPLGAIGSLEFSQNFTTSNATVRLSFEPTSYRATTGADACNRLTTDHILQRFKEIGVQLDLELYHQLLPLLTVTDKDEEKARAQGVLANFPFCGQNYLGLDLNGHEVGVKLYLCPLLKSTVAGIAPLSLVCNALRVLELPHIAALPMIEQFVATSSDTLTFLTFGCDLVEPAKTRFKIYFTERQVTLDRLEEIWTLNGQLADADILKGTSLLRELWDSLQIPEGLHSSLSLKRVQQSDPPSALPLLFNLEIHSNNDPPRVKIYFPVGGINDNVVANALDAFFARNGFCQPAIDYRKHLPTHVAGLDLHESTHLQMWVSFTYSVQKGPGVTVYYH